MDKVWSINVKVPQGYQWWHVAFDAEADARIAIAKAFPEAQIVDAMRARNAFQVKDGASYQLPNTASELSHSPFEKRTGQHGKAPARTPTRQRGAKTYQRLPFIEVTRWRLIHIPK